MLERTDLANDSFGLLVMEAEMRELRERQQMKQMDEEIVQNPETGGRKGQKLARFDLLPADVLWAVAEHFGRGARKYDERNWELGYKWSLSYGALQRHLHAFWNGEDIDPETGSHHLDAVIFHAMALRRFTTAHQDLDDRP